MAFRLGIRALCRACSNAGILTSKKASSVSNTFTRVLVPNKLYSSGGELAMIIILGNDLYLFEFVMFVATSQLLKRVNTELKLEQKPVGDLQSVFSSFELTTDGSLATLKRQHDLETIKIQLDANSAIEASSDDVEFEGEEEDEESEVS